ncbi:hypothetical protein [Citrobacter koseri]
MDITSSKEVWLTIGNTDLTEGRGYGIILYVCESQETALRLGRGKYVQGSNCPIEKSMAHLINKRWYIPGEIVSESDDDKKRRKVRENRESVIEKMREQGFSEEEIASVIK